MADQPSETMPEDVRQAFGEFSYGPDILDMYRRAAARSAPLPKTFRKSCASPIVGKIWGPLWSRRCVRPADDLADCGCGPSERVALAVSTLLF